MSNIVTKMLLDDKDYNSKLDKAKKSAKSYKSEMETMGKTIGTGMVNAFGAFAGAVGLAGGAVETFTRLVASSQTTQDAWDRTIRVAKTTVETFFSALSTGDFSTFLGGLDAIIARARIAADALDALGNANMSYSYFTTRNQAEFAEAITTMRDNEAGYGNRMAAKATAEAILGNQQEITDELKKKITTALQSIMTEKNFLTAEQIGTIDLAHILSLDITAGGEAEKQRLAAEYQQYLQELSELPSIRRTSGYVQTGRMNRRTGAPELQYVKASTPEEIAAYDAALTSIADKYKDAVLYNTMLETQSDEWLQNIINLENQMDRADKLMADMTRQLNRAGNIAPEEPARQMGALPKASQLVTGDVHANIPDKLPELKLDNVNRDMQQLQTNTISATDSLDAMATVMSSLGGFIDDSSDSWLNWCANLLGAISRAVPAIQTLTASELKEATASSAGAVAGGAKSVASIPWVGAAMAVAAAASIAAAIASAPKFATGGVVPGDSFSGDNVLARLNSGEVVLSRQQQNILSERIDTPLHGKVEFIIRGNQLVGVLNNYNRTASRNVNIG